MSGESISIETPPCGRAFGAVLSFLFLTVQEYVAGLSSTLSAASLATTVNTCLPLPTLCFFGEVQRSKALPSRLHLNVDFSEALNRKVAFFHFVFFGGRFVMLVFWLGPPSVA
jgi:hypothetical protein